MTAPRVATVTRVSGTGPGEVPGWVERWGAIVLVVGLSLYLITTAIWLLVYAHQIDMSIYRSAVSRLSIADRFMTSA